MTLQGAARELSKTRPERCQTVSSS